MSVYLGDVNASSVVEIYFATAAAAGGVVAPSSAFEVADVVVYKNHSTTQRSSAAGMTMTSPFDSIVGLHQLSIDTSDNTDAGFWAAGSDYTVVLIPDTETVDGQTIVAVLARFSIANRSALRPTTAGRTLVVDAAGLADANVVKVGPTGSGTAQTAGDLKASLTALFTTALTESYGADGAAPTLAQAVFLIMQRLTEFAISSTTLTIKKLDGSTSAATLTLNDATNPTSVTRAT